RNKMSKSTNIIRLLFLFALHLPLVNYSTAQEEVFSMGFQLGTGARALGMGGAFTAVGGDYSASFWNPAALAAVKRIEVFGSVSHLMRENTTEFSTLATEHDASFTKLKDFGLAYPVPTIRGSLVFSFGFNRIKSFDSNFAFQWFNSTEDDLVTQAWRDLQNGSLNAWILAGAVDVSRNLSVGLGINFWTGGDDFESTFRERDRDDIYTFETYTVENNLNSDITGANVKLGALYRLNNFIRFGATIATPTTFKVEEDWSFNEELTFGDGTSVDTLDAGFFEYKIRSPWTFTAGASINLLNFVLSGDVEYNDWSQIQYTTEPPIEGLSETEANRLIRDNYRPTTRIRLGAEFTLPLTGLSFRAGYSKDPSILQNRDPDEDKQFYTAGLGFLLNKQVKLDVAFVHGFWKSFNSGLPETNDIGDNVEDIKVNKVFVSFAFRI
ncbi:MAG: OmpP1/FadL family transporter, partial [bacterium]